MFGGFFYANNGTPAVPAIVNENAYLTANYKINLGSNYPVHISDTRNTTTREFIASEAVLSVNVDLYSSAPISHEEHPGIIAPRNKESGNYLRYKDGQFSMVALTSSQLSSWSTHKFSIIDLEDGNEALQHGSTGQYLWYKNNVISVTSLNSTTLQTWNSHKLEFRVQEDGYFWIKHPSTGAYLYDKLSSGVKFEGLPQTTWDGAKWEIVSISPNTSARRASREEPGELTHGSPSSSVSIYPIPSQETVTIDLGGMKSRGVTVFDLQGRVFF
ncbi:MAG: hypothetical protein MJA30_11745 [Cytophagales bacterium]|nr:hypothetical protein [Cytophagales bacterium]